MIKKNKIGNTQILYIILITILIAFSIKCIVEKNVLEKNSINKETEYQSHILELEKDNNILNSKIKEMTINNENQKYEIEELLNQASRYEIRSLEYEDFINSINNYNIVLDTIFYDNNQEKIIHNSISEHFDESFSKFENYGPPMSHRETGQFYQYFISIWEQEAQETYEYLLNNIDSNQIEILQDYYENWIVVYKGRYSIATELIYSDAKKYGGYSFWVFVELMEDRYDKIEDFTLFLKELVYLQTDQVDFYFDPNKLITDMNESNRKNLDVLGFEDYENDEIFLNYICESIARQLGYVYDSNSTLMLVHDASYNLIVKFIGIDESGRYEIQLSPDYYPLSVFFYCYIDSDLKGVTLYPDDIYFEIE